MNDATKHGGPVDVRKDLNSIASLLEQLRQNNAAIMLDRVSVAVAELIEANRELLIEWDRQDNGMFDVMPAKDWAVAEARFRAALANVGSAS